MRMVTAVLAAIFSSTAFGQGFTADVEIFDPATGASVTLDSETAQGLTLAASEVGVRSTVTSSRRPVTIARISAIGDNADACASVRITLREFPAEFVIPAALDRVQCRYLIGYWADGWNWQGRDDVTLLWMDGGVSVLATAGLQLGEVVTPAPQPEPAPEPAPEPDPMPDMDAPRYVFTVGSENSTQFNVGSVVSRSSHGNRIYCPVSHFSYDDPVIFPAQTGVSHLHMFWGNTAADAFLRGEDILNPTGSTCEGGTGNQSSSWIPTLFNDDDEVVIPEEIIVYYKTFGNLNYAQLQEIPAGLEMLADRNTTNFTRWTKLGYDRVGGWFRIRAPFPSCVATENGERTGNPILKYRDMPGDAASIPNSHVSYPGGPNMNSVGCPATHPYRFPGVAFEIRYSADEVGANPYIASDRMFMPYAENMSTLHADYVAGLSDEVNAELLRCIQESRDCQFTGSRDQLPERFYSPDGVQVYRNSVQLMPSTDRTPFSDSLTPMLEGVMHDHMGH